MERLERVYPRLSRHWSWAMTLISWGMLLLLAWAFAMLVLSAEDHYGFSWDKVLLTAGATGAGLLFGALTMLITAHHIPATKGRAIVMRHDSRYLGTIRGSQSGWYLPMRRAGMSWRSFLRARLVVDLIPWEIVQVVTRGDDGVEYRALLTVEVDDTGRIFETGPDYRRNAEWVIVGALGAESSSDVLTHAGRQRFKGRLQTALAQSGFNATKVHFQRHMPEWTEELPD